MKRMNLLPPELLPRDGGRRGSSYMVVGALFAAIVAMLAYGFVIRGVHTDERELAGLQEDTRRAEARAEALDPYADFAAMKDTRARSVQTVAQSRFDYERLTRELARILPGGVWVSSLEVAPAEPSDEAAAQGADSVEPVAASGSTMQIAGCARSQDAVAETLDHLRALTGASAVELGSSGRTDEDETGSGGGEPYLVAGTGTGQCGAAGRPRVAFDARVTLSTGGGSES